VRFQHPSPELAPFARFDIDVPDGWQPDEAPDTIGMFVDPAAQDYRVNVMVGADRVPAETDLEDIAQVTLEGMSENTAFRVEREKVEEIDGQPASLRFQSFELEGAPDRLLQMQVLFFNPPDGRSKTRDVFHIDGTCLARDADRYEPIFLEIASSFRFTR